MLLRITNKCYMECNHCLVNATPEGPHMNDIVFDQCVKFVNRINPNVLLLTGGEPTTHPNLIEWIKRLQRPNKAIVLTSNGMFLEDDNLTNQIRELADNKWFVVQITNDERYYPKRIKKVNIPGFNYIDKLTILSNHGRARDNKLPITKSTPDCFNLRSIARSGKSRDFAHVVSILESANKFCQPSINYDGSIAVGEGDRCHVIGDVYDTDADLFYGLKYMKCNECDSLKNLTPFHRSCIGE